jgi:hypothetical protein
MNSELQMTLALKMHGLAAIALVLSLSFGLDLWLAHLMGNAGGAPIVQMWGVGFNGTQIGLCLLAFAMSSWKACGLLHIRIAICQKRCGYAAVAAILLACAVTISAVVELSWLEGHLTTEVAAKPLQRGANLSTIFASANSHEGILIVFLQLATATLPLIVLGDVSLADPAAKTSCASPASGQRVESSLSITADPVRTPTTSERTAASQQVSRPPAPLGPVQAMALSAERACVPCPGEGSAPTTADRVPIPTELGPTASSQKAGGPGPRLSPVHATTRPAQRAWAPGSDVGAPPILADAVWTPKPEPAAASGRAGGPGPHPRPVEALTRPSQRTRASGFNVSSVPTPADLVPTPSESRPAAASQQAGAPASYSAAQAMAQPAERVDVRSASIHADAVPTPKGIGRNAAARQASVGPVHLTPTQAMARVAQRALVPVSTVKPAIILADPVPTLEGAGRIAANRRARGLRLPLSPSQAAAAYLDWALAHGLEDRMWSVNDVWHIAAEDFVSATDIVLPPRNLFLGALKKLPGVRVQYDKRIWVGSTRTKTTVYVFSAR